MIAFQSNTALMALMAILRFKAESKIQTDVVDELLYADCVTKNVLTEKMQETMDRVSQACDSYELKIRKKKIEIGYLESPKWSQPSQ